MANFGIDLLLESQKANIRNKNDIVVILMHWMLCKNDLRNVGVGESRDLQEDERPSELLPEGWNTSEENKYSLRYTHDKQIYVLHAIVTGDSLLVNLLDGKTLNTESLILEVNKIVKDVRGLTLDDFVADSEALIKKVEAKLVNPIIKKTEKKEEGESSSNPNPLMVQPPRQVIPPYYDGGRGLIRDRDPLRDIGRGDLDPFGRGGGGMIFTPDMPFRPGGFGPLGPLPGMPGAMGIPPGARYDPPNPLRRLDPDNDHFQPPGMAPPGYDDMFM